MTTRPATVNFRLYPYATFTETTTLLDSEQAPIDLTGRSALMHIRRDREDTTPVFTLSTADGSIALGGEDGTIVLSIPAADTAPTLTPPIDPEGEVWYHDLLLTDPSTTPATTERTYQGILVVLPGVTRPGMTPTP